MVCVRSSAARLQPAKMAMVVTSSMTTRLSDIADNVLLSNTKALVKSGRAVTAELLLHLGEVDARRLYLGLAYPPCSPGASVPSASRKTRRTTTSAWPAWHAGCRR